VIGKRKGIVVMQGLKEARLRDLLGSCSRNR
jgi:hypothetical protein